MKKLTFGSAAATGIGLDLLCAAARAATQDDILSNITLLMWYGSLIFVVTVVIAVYFMKSRDKRRVPLNQLYSPGEAIHAVDPDAPVTECVRMMTDEKIGALVVMDGGSLKGIFTERDALNKVLAAGRDPGRTRVSEVMTTDPYCIAPTTSVGDAMAVITQRRFRHLPVVESGRLVAVISSGDLTRWLVKDRLGEVKELVGLAAQS